MGAPRCCLPDHPHRFKETRDGATSHSLHRPVGRPAAGNDVPRKRKSSATMVWSWPAGATTWSWTRPWRSPATWTTRRSCWPSTASSAGRSPTTSPASSPATSTTMPARTSSLRQSATGNSEAKRRWAVEAQKKAARVAKKFGVKVVNGFTGSPIWHLLYIFPPVSAEMIEEGFQRFAEIWNPILDVYDAEGVRFALEVHPTEIAFDIVTARRGAEGSGPAQGVRLQLRSQPPALAGGRPGEVHPGVRRPDLPRAHEGRDRHPGRRHRASSPATSISASPAAAGISAASGRGEVNFEEIIRELNRIGYEGPLSVEWEDAGMDREHGAPRGLRVRA